MKIIFSLYVWLMWIPAVVLPFPLALLIWLLSFPFDPNRKLLHYYTSIYAYIIFSVNPFWKLSIIDKHKFPKNKPFIILCNHQSMIDIMVLCQIHRHYKWVAKQELFKTPILGWVMQMNKYIPIERTNATSAANMFDLCKKNLKQGNSIMIFPEGTRTKNGQISNFKDGAFRLAIESKTDIIPILLDGTFNILPKKGFILKAKQNIVVKVLDPISYENFPSKHPKELKEYFKNLYDKELNSLRNS